jgi:hypothetical protein
MAAGVQVNSANESREMARPAWSFACASFGDGRFWSFGLVPLPGFVACFLHTAFIGGLVWPLTVLQHFKLGP